MSGQRSSSRPTRKVTNNASRVDLLLFVEGKKTEEQYLTAWHRRHRQQVNIEFSKTRGAPLTLIQAAVDAKKEDERDLRKGRGRPHDQIWCVFDRDEHLHLPRVFELASAHDIKIAFSDPCIELWFLIHFQDQWSELHRHAAQRIVRELLKCDKSLTAEAIERLVSLYEDARSRASLLDAKHSRDGRPPRSNPSSDIWKLVDVIRTASRTPAPRQNGS